MCWTWLDVVGCGYQLAVDFVHTVITHNAMADISMMRLVLMWTSLHISKFHIQVTWQSIKKANLDVST